MHEPGDVTVQGEQESQPQLPLEGQQPDITLGELGSPLQQHGNKKHLLRIPDKRKEDQLLLQEDPAQLRGAPLSSESSPPSRGGSDQLSRPVMVLPKAPLGAHPIQRPTKLRSLESQGQGQVLPARDAQREGQQPGDLHCEDWQLSLHSSPQ